jgi:hypothetical protein
VGWQVLLDTPRKLRPVPYTVSFFSPNFFGVDALEVPTGGTSDFLVVRELKGSTEWSLDLTGIGTVLDPEVQSGSDGALVFLSSSLEHVEVEDLFLESIPAKVVTKIVKWYTGQQKMTWRLATSSQEHDFALVAMPISKTDGIAFTTDLLHEPQDLAAQFGPNPPATVWASPDDPDDKQWMASDGAMAVTDNVDPHGTRFEFTLLSTGLMSPPLGEMYLA